MAVEEQVVSIFAGTKGYLDSLPVADVGRFEIDLLEYVRTRHPEILETVRTTGALPDGDALAHAVDAFVKVFAQHGQAARTRRGRPGRRRGPNRGWAGRGHPGGTRDRPPGGPRVSDLVARAGSVA